MPAKMFSNLIGAKSDFIWNLVSFVSVIQASKNLFVTSPKPGRLPLLSCINVIKIK